MERILTDLHLMRRYAEDNHLGNEEGALATAIRILVKLGHFDIDKIKKHYAGGRVALPQARTVDQPIKSPMAPPVPGEPNDLLMNPVKVQTHAPSTDMDNNGGVQTEAERDGETDETDETDVHEQDDEEERPPAQVALAKARAARDNTAGSR